MFVSRLLVICCLASATLAYDPYKDIGDIFPYVDSVTEEYYKIPEGFILGAGSSAYQTEGAWNEDGKGESIWDYFFHYQHPGMTPNGDVACDSYHKYKEDVLLVKNLKLNTYRFSLSWPRLLPNGTTDYVNQQGVDFYNNFINEIISSGITPLVTLFHWDLPQALQEKGGFMDASIQDYFLDYATFAFQTFGDRVQWWTTFNEPHIFCSLGYENGTLAPGITDPGVGLYQCAHNMILAHAKAYQAYYSNFSLQGGQVGITLDLDYSIPLDVNSTADREAADRYMQFTFAWLADPIVFGKYPDVMRTTIDANSVAEGRNVSRLPEFTAAEEKMLQAATDFLGLNHYGSVTATPTTRQTCSSEPSNDADVAVTTDDPPGQKLGTRSSYRTPWGFRGVLNWIKNRYNNYPTLVTENGYDGTEEEGLNDFNRTTYLSGFMRAALRATNQDNCNVIGYNIWSLIDNNQWAQGNGWLGLYFTHFENPDRQRVAKKSTNFIRQVMTSRRVAYYDYSDLGR